MTIQEFAETVEFNIQHDLKHAVLGLGAPGVGKSQVIRQIGDKFGFKVIDIRLAQMSEVEIGGLIYPNESRTKTVWLAPDILPNEERDGKNTILLLDEITSCPKRVQVAAYQLILDRRIGQYQLPEGTFVVALGNREDDDGVYIKLAGPLADRFEIHYIEPDFHSWKYDFALKNDVHPFVVDYLTWRPSALHNQDPESDVLVFATPRSWVRVSDILKIDSDVSKTVVRHKIIGNVGEAEGTQFVEFCRKHKSVVTADDYMAGRSPAPDDPDQLSVLTSGIVSKAPRMAASDTYESLDEAGRGKLAEVFSALVRLPRAEYAIIGLKALMKKNPELVKDAFARLDAPEVMQFIRKNGYTLGLEENGAISQQARNNWMSLWK